MKVRKVIPHKYLPMQKPITSTMLQLFLLDYYNAPQWLFGIWITLAVLVWIAVISNIWYQEKDESLIIHKDIT